MKIFNLEDKLIRVRFPNSSTYHNILICTMLDNGLPDVQIIGGFVFVTYYFNMDTVSAKMSIDDYITYMLYFTYYKL